MTKKIEDEEIYGKRLRETAGPDEGWPVINSVNGKLYYLKQENVHVQVMSNPTRKTPFLIPTGGPADDLKSKLMAGAIVVFTALAVPLSIAIYRAASTGQSAFEAAKEAALDAAPDATQSGVETVTGDGASTSSGKPSVDGLAGKSGSGSKGLSGATNGPAVSKVKSTLTIEEIDRISAANNGLGQKYSFGVGTLFDRSAVQAKGSAVKNRESKDLVLQEVNNPKVDASKPPADKPPRDKPVDRVAKAEKRSVVGSEYDAYKRYLEARQLASGTPAEELYTSIQGANPSPVDQGGGGGGGGSSGSATGSAGQPQSSPQADPQFSNREVRDLLGLISQTGESLPSASPISP